MFNHKTNNACTLFSQSESLNVHTALRQNNFESVNLILNNLQTLDAATFSQLLDTDKEGYTPLHIAARYCDLKTFLRLLLALGPKAKSAAEKLTHAGLLPLMLAQKNQTSDRRAIKKILFDLTIEKTAEDLSRPLLFADVLTQNPSIDVHNQKLLDNLNFGCIAATYARAFIKASSTHTNCNRLDKTNFKALDDEIGQLRAEYNFLNSQITEVFEKKRLPAKLANIEKIVAQHGKGNCLEHVCLALNILIKMQVQTSVEAFMVNKSNHIFLVIGKDPDTPCNDYTKWGPHAVVVDAWAGAVFPASEIPQKLKTYTAYKNKHDIKKACITIPFDAHYHSLQQYYSLSNSIFRRTEYTESFEDDVLENSIAQQPYRYL